MYSYNPYYETYLAHFGVKGMRWGVRKDPARAAAKAARKAEKKKLKAERKAKRKAEREEYRKFRRDLYTEQEVYARERPVSSFLMGKAWTVKNGEATIRRNLDKKWGEENTDRLMEKYNRRAMARGAAVLGVTMGLSVAAALSGAYDY